MPLKVARAGNPDPVVLATCNIPAYQQLGIASNSVGISAALGNANRALFFPVRLADTHTYTKAFWLNGGTLNGNTDVGIYTISGSTATRVVACTAEAQSGASAMQVAATFTSTTLSPGIYYLALSTSSATATYWRTTPTIAAYNQGHGAFMISSGAHPLPSSGTVVQIANVTLPVFGFSESTAI